MNSFANLLQGALKYTVTGFDRIVFKGTLLNLVRPEGVVKLLRTLGVRHTELKTWLLTQSSDICRNAERIAAEHDLKVEHLNSYKIRKENLVHNEQEVRQISEGLIGIWSCMETGHSYRARFDPGNTMPKLSPYQSLCKHLYFYYDHAEYGFMNIRLQTWLPYNIQICMNGREMLFRSLEKSGIEFTRAGNKLLDIGDVLMAQQFLDAQVNLPWQSILEDFVPLVFPSMENALGPFYKYYWTLWQSEWATDFICNSPQDAELIMPPLQKHAFLTGTSQRVIKYLGQPLRKDGQPYQNFSSEVISRNSGFYEGSRVRHYVGKNSVKLYVEHNNIRVESTINDPGMFKVMRHAAGESAEAPKKSRPLRKGIADINMRAKVSGDINKRFMDNMAQMKNTETLNPLLKDIAKRVSQDGRHSRGLNLFGKDREILAILADPCWEVNGISNKELRMKLCSINWSNGGTEKQFSAKVSRLFRLLRDHGLLRKQQNRHRYNLTEKGRKIVHCVAVIPALSLDHLQEIAA
jgi:hypothetical protein